MLNIAVRNANKKIGNIMLELVKLSMNKII